MNSHLATFLVNTWWPEWRHWSVLIASILSTADKMTDADVDTMFVAREARSSGS